MINNIIKYLRVGDYSHASLCISGLLKHEIADLLAAIADNGLDDIVKANVSPQVWYKLKLKGVL